MNKNDYFGMDRISNSQLDDFSVSPEFYKWARENRKETPQMSLGSALHYLILEPENFEKYMVVMDETKRPEPTKDYRTVVNKEWKDKFLVKAKAEGKEVIDLKQYNDALEMQHKLLNTPESKDLLQYTRKEFEKVVIWEWNGIKFKSKHDENADLFICDLKSCSNADIYDFQKTIFNNRLYRQAGMYVDGDSISTESLPKDFYFIAIESAPPYGISVHLVQPEVIQYGIEEYRKLALALEDCKKKDFWPTYTYKCPDGINKIYLPKYLKNDD